LEISETQLMSNIVSARQLKAARVMAGLTQSELSTESGFNSRACRYWESRGDNPPTSVPSTLQAIEAVLLRYGIEVFSAPAPGCRIVSIK
jgi:DNA-binding transcriptional regulator YiaG